jgi:hypothetical protein
VFLQAVEALSVNFDRVLLQHFCVGLSLFSSKLIFMCPLFCRSKFVLIISIDITLSICLSLSFLLTLLPYQRDFDSLEDFIFFHRYDLCASDEVSLFVIIF